MMPFAAIYGPRDYQGKLTEKDKYHMKSLLHEILKKGTNEFLYKTTVELRMRKLMVTRNGREEQEFERIYADLQDR